MIPKRLKNFGGKQFRKGRPYRTSQDKFSTSDNSSSSPSGMADHSFEQDEDIRDEEVSYDMVRKEE